MTVYAIWPAFASVGVVVLLACLPVFGRAGFQSNGVGRVRTIDGARGFLALAVVLHHGVIYYTFVRDGSWVVPPSRFYTLSGQVGVSCFFIITGYLFWSKAVRARGSLDFVDLMLGRLFRLGPIYLLVVLIAIAINFVRSGAVLNIPFAEFMMQLAQNLALGLFSLVDMNGVQGFSLTTAGVTWTLQYEWYFYLLLPLLSVFAINERVHLPFSLISFAAMLFLASVGGRIEPVLCAVFAAGMACASLENKGLIVKLSPVLLSLVVVILWLVLYLAYETAYLPGVALLLGASFYFILAGASIFGLLLTRPSIRLGELSYDIYLLQGIILYLAFAMPSVRSFALASDINHWIVLSMVMVVLLFVALVAHLLVERPGVEIGNRLRAMRQVNSSHPDRLATSLTQP